MPPYWIQVLLILTPTNVFKNNTIESQLFDPKPAGYYRVSHLGIAAHERKAQWLTIVCLYLLWINSNLHSNEWQVLEQSGYLMYLH